MARCSSTCRTTSGGPSLGEGNHQFPRSVQSHQHAAEHRARLIGTVADPGRNDHARRPDKRTGDHRPQPADADTPRAELAGEPLQPQRNITQRVVLNPIDAAAIKENSPGGKFDGLLPGQPVLAPQPRPSKPGQVH
jgi:hypothetical protein